MTVSDSRKLPDLGEPSGPEMPSDPGKPSGLGKPEAPPLPLTRLTPEPSNFWVDAAARMRGDDELPWTDLRNGTVGGAADTVRSSAGNAVSRAGRRLPSSVYLPPPRATDRASAEALIEWSTRIGAGVVAQVLPGSGVSPSIRCWPVWDLLAVVLEGAWERLDTVPTGATVLWPLVTGLTDTPERIDEGLAVLERRQPQAVAVTVPRLSPKSRRRLIERAGESSFEAAFHGGGPDARPFAAACLRRGLEVSPARPHWPHQRSDRLAGDIAAELGLIAERLADRRDSEPRAQAFYRAARWFEATEHDVRGLWRDGNLGIVPWVDAEIERVVDELARGASRSSRLDEATAAWLTPGCAG